MSRYARRVDSNQGEIVETLEAMHVQVINLSRVGGGIPDLLCVVAGQMHLVEIKSDGGTLTPDQVEFHENWTGPPIVILRTLRDAECFVIRERMRSFQRADE